MNITKKIVAIVTTLTVFVWLGGAGSAQALTAAELQVQIDALLANLATLQSQLSALQSGGTTSSAACSGITFSRNLSQGSSGNDVKCLQSILNQSADTQIAASGTGSAGNETTYFGSLTKIAVVKFQNKYASEVLTPAGLTAGTGFVGAKTRTKLNTMTGGVPAGCSCTSWVTGACQSGTNAGKKVQTRTCTPAACSTETQYVTDATCAVGGQNKVSLAADTPAAATIAQGAQNVIFLKLNFCAAETANTVTKIIITRAGIAADADFSYIKLYDGTTQIGATQALNSTTHKATFSSISWTIPASSCKVLTVKGSIAASGATSGDSPKLTINAASDITSTIALDGVFPIQSNAMTLAGISAGWIDISTSTSPSGTVIAGATEQAVADFILTATGTEAVKVHAVKVTEVGSSVDADVANIKLFYQTTQLGSTVAALTGGSAEFDLSSAPLEILAGSSKTIKVYVDVGSTIGIYDRNIKFQITANTDVTAYGSNSGGSLVIYGVNKESDEWPLKGQQIEIDLGSLTVAQDTTYSPAAQDYSRGTTQDSIVAFKFSAGAYEGIRITQLKLKEAVASSSDSDFFNVTLYDALTGAIVGGPAGVVSGYVTFGSYTSGLDATGLFDIEKSKNRIILVKADISSAAATSNEQLGFQILNSQTDVKADGLSSQNDLATGDISPSTPLGATLLHDVIDYGTLTVSANSGTPSAANYSLGTENFTFAKFDLTSTGEDIKVTQFNVYFAASDTNATSDAAVAAHLNNVELWEGTTLLKTDPTISSGYADFGINLTVPKNTTKTLTVIADIPTGSTATDSLQAFIVQDDDITAEGASSALTVTAVASSWDNVRGSVMSYGAPGLTIQAAATPATQTFIKNAAGKTLATLYFTASSTEDLKVTRIKLAGDATSATATAGYATTSFTQTDSDNSEVGLLVYNMVSNIKLYDGSTQIGSTVPTMTNGTNYDYADFTGLSMTVPKGTTKALSVVMDITDSTTTAGTPVYFFFGIATSTDLAGTGVQSGTALDSETMYSLDTGFGIAGQPMLFGSAGSLTVAQDVDTAISAELIGGSSKAALGSWKFTATNENINITKLTFDVTHSAAATGSSLSYSSPTTSIDSYASPTIDVSLNDDSTSTSGLGISQLNQSATTVVLNTLELTAAVNASMTAGAVAQISGNPYIVDSINDNGSESTTTVIGKGTTISDADGLSIDILTVATDTTFAGCQATGTQATADSSGHLAVTVWGGLVTVNLDCATITANTLLEVGGVGSYDYAIATDTGPSAGAGLTGTLYLLARAGAVVDPGDYVATTSTSSPTTANTIAYNDADTGAEIAAYLSTIANATASFTGDSTYDVSGDSGYYSVEIADGTDGDNVADELNLGLKYGGTESIGRYAGADANAPAVYLYAGTELLGTSYIGADVSGKVVFETPTNAPYVIPVGNKILTLKADLSTYTAMLEGSTIKFTLGDSTNNNDDLVYITAKGASSGTAIDQDSINGSSALGTLASNEMWLYGTKPTVTLNSASPSGTEAPGSNAEVFRFDVANSSTASGIDLSINAIRFSVSVNSTSTDGATLIWDKTFKLYKSTDLSTVIGTGISTANATSSGTTGWVTIYPHTSYQVGSGSTNTYILKADTSSMNLDSATVENLNIKIDTDDFYFDDGYAANANKKVSNLPVEGNTLSY